MGLRPNNTPKPHSMSDDPDCLGMCAIDGDVCTGCGRTLDQINAALGDERDEPPALRGALTAAGP